MLHHAFVVSARPFCARSAAKRLTRTINFNWSRAPQFTPVHCRVRLGLMDVAHQANADQIAYWNGPNGQRWTDRQASQDVLLAPVAQLLVDRIGPIAGNRIIDIGCGCGAISIALAERVAPGGFVLGVDISAPMLARARQLARKGLPLDFVQAD